MNTTDNAQPEPEAYEIAGFRDRAIARAVDGFVTSCIWLVTWVPASFVVLWLVFASGMAAAATLFVLMVIAASVPVVLYEVHPTARHGNSEQCLSGTGQEYATMFNSSKPRNKPVYVLLLLAALTATAK